MFEAIRQQGNATRPDGPTGTKPDPGRFLATMSASWVLIDMATAGVCNGMYLMMQVGSSSAKAPWIMPTSRLLTVTGAPESPGWPQTWLTIVPGLAGTPDDATRVAGGPAELARDLAGRRVGPETVDLEAVDVVHRRDLGRVELDHRVVEGVIARHHRAEHTAGLRPLGAHLRPWAAAVCGGEADQVAAVVIADGGQVHNVSPLTTSPEPPPSGSGSSACARCGRCQ